MCTKFTLLKTLHQLKGPGLFKLKLKARPKSLSKILFWVSRMAVLSCHGHFDGACDAGSIIVERRAGRRQDGFDVDPSWPLVPGLFDEVVSLDDDYYGKHLIWKRRF